MKSLKFLLAILIATSTLVSCNSDNDGDYPQYAPLITTVHTINGGTDYYFERDNGQTLYPSDKTRVADYVPTDMQRAIIYFNLLSNIEGYTYNIALYSVEHIYTATAKVVTTQAEIDALGSSKVGVVDGATNLTEKWLTLLVSYTASYVEKHTFSLVKNELHAPAEQEDGYLNLELYHNDGEDSNALFGQSYISFNMEDLAADLVGKKGIIMRVLDLNGVVEYITIDFTSTEGERGIE